MRLVTVHLRRAAIAAVTALTCAVVVGGAAGPAVAEPIPLQERVLLGEGTFDVVNPCTGETVVLTGSSYQQTTGVFFTDGFFVSVVQIVTTATGTGVESGTRYRFDMRVRNPVHASFDLDPATSSGGGLTTTQRLVSQGPGDNFYLVIKTFVMTDANGVTRVSYVVEDSGCLG